MNITKTITAIAIIGLAVVSCKHDEKPTEVTTNETKTEVVKKTIAVANVQTASFEITGMTCAVGCAKTIEKKLAELEGVEKATVDFDKKLATVSFDKTVQNPTSLTQVIEGVADGKSYKVVNTKS